MNPNNQPPVEIAKLRAAAPDNEEGGPTDQLVSMLHSQRSRLLDENAKLRAAQAEPPAEFAKRYSELLCENRRLKKQAGSLIPANLAKALRDLLIDVEAGICDGDSSRDARALLDGMDVTHPAEPSHASRIEWSLRQIIEADDAQALTQEIIEAGRSALATHQPIPTKGNGQ